MEEFLQLMREKGIKPLNELKTATTKLIKRNYIMEPEIPPYQELLDKEKPSAAKEPILSHETVPTSSEYPTSTEIEDGSEEEITYSSFDCGKIIDMEEEHSHMEESQDQKTSKYQEDIPIKRASEAEHNVEINQLICLCLFTTITL